MNRDSVDEVLEKDLENINLNGFEKVDARTADDLHHLMEFSESEEEALKEELRAIEELEETVNKGLHLADEIHKYDQELANLKEKIETMLESDESVPNKLINSFKDDLESLESDLNNMFEVLRSVVNAIDSFKTAVEEEQERIYQLEDVQEHLAQGMNMIKGENPEGLSVETWKSTSDTPLNYDDGMMGEIENMREDLDKLMRR